MRKTIGIIILASALLIALVAASIPGNVKGDILLRVGSSKAMVKGSIKFIDGKNVNVIPFSKDKTIFVPLRFIVEAQGGKITANGKDAYTVTVNGITSNVTKGSTAITVNKKRMTMKAAAAVANDRLYIPVSSAADIMGQNVFNEKGLIVIGGNKTSLTAAEIDSLLSQLSVIPSFASYKELYDYTDKERYNDMEDYGVAYRNEAEPMFSPQALAPDGIPAPTAAPVPSPAASTGLQITNDGAADFSQTNIQVQGVDEADIIRTDGKYIYALASNRLVIVEAYPASGMKVLSRLEIKGGVPSEMYADKDKLTVIGHDNNYNRAVVTVIDISDKSNPKTAKEVKIEGFYLSSRKIDDVVYVVTNSYMYGYPIKNEPPRYYVDDKTVQIPAPLIYRFPVKSSGSLTIAGISLDDLNAEPHVSQYLGAGNNIYVSKKYMYLAEDSYSYDDVALDMPWARFSYPMGQRQTIIHKFALNDGQVDFIGTGLVPGYILNQFSMDEYDSHFRIATNANDANNVYILDSQLEIKSKIEDIAPGERIYSTRFMGAKGYMVTFKQTDPLFVIDMNPDNPKILGALKIPGYSDYLHPYDENTLIGFGKDTVESKGIVYYQGVKIALFDVSDVNNPKEKFQTVIGGRGTESALLYDHKALLFDKAKNLLALPVTVYEGGDGISSYGAFSFQGAYVYDISLDKGFVKRGEITHMTADEYKKSGVWYDNYYYDSSEIKRIIYIGDSLYAMSQRQLSAHDIKTVREAKSVKLTP